jgi:hypothetical protein
MKGGTYVFFLVRAIHSILLGSFKSTTIRIIATIAFCLPAFPQGTVIFSTFEPDHNVEAPVRICSIWPSRDEFTLQLFLYDHGVYTPLYPATTFRTDLQVPPIFVVVPDQPVMVPGFPPGTSAPLVLRYYDTAAGSYDNAVLRGQSPVANVLLGGGSNPPTYLTGLQGFMMVGPCLSNTIRTRGGITYFGLTAPACPSLQVVTESAGKAFRIIPVQTDCDAESYNTTHFFVLGALPPGNYKIFYDANNPNTDVPWYFTIPENSAQKTISNFRINGESRASFEIKGESNFTYIVQRSSDLETWTEIGRVHGSLDFTEPAPAPSGLPHYYKVQVEPPPEPTP